MSDERKPDHQMSEERKPDHNVKPPKDFVINPNENVARAWKLWLQQFEWYAIATHLEDKKPAVQVAVFMSCVGQEAAVIYNTFNLTETESLQLQTIKNKFTNHFTPKINETYERYVFNGVVQKDGQSFDDFVTELKSKVKNCGYGTLEDSLIRDRILVGIKSDLVREKLLTENNPTLEKTIEICHSAEQVSLQANTMKQAAAVDAVTCNRKNMPMKKPGKTFHCGRCDTIHGYRNCPAFREVCDRCKRKNHFTKCCKARTVECVQQYEDDDENGFIVSSLDAEQDVDVEDWYEQAAMPNGVKIKFKLDSGSQCNVISRKIVEKTKMQIKPSTTKYLTSFSNHKMAVLGEVQMKTTIKGQSKLIKYIVVEEDVSPVLDMKNTEVSMDDVLLHASTKEELEEITQKVLEKLKKQA
ncbi:uncharacterized protein [Choristoneura fumiferana]|uniref:uncharacterized protein n=1 Tax=Choristoneura fumiferana TaxID=7141 RepID=UPI003D157630